VYDMSQTPASNDFSATEAKVFAPYAVEPRSRVLSLDIGESVMAPDFRLIRAELAPRCSASERQGGFCYGQGSCSSVFARP
jgi:hypothetical protein